MILVRVVQEKCQSLLDRSSDSQDLEEKDWQIKSLWDTIEYHSFI